MPQSKSRTPAARALYGDPLVLILATWSVALAFALVARPTEINKADFFTFWDSAQWHREGVDPYLGHTLRPGAPYNLNPPALLLVFLPFSYLPLRSAFVLWDVLGIGACILAGFWIAREVRLQSPLYVIGAILISQATFAGLQLGQLTFILLLLFTGAWLADRHERPWTAGILLGVLIAAKLFLGLFIIYAVLFRRSVSLLLGIILGALSVFGLGMIVGGASAYWSWISVLRHVTWSAHLSNASLLGALSRELSVASGLDVTPVAVRPEWVNPLWLAGVAGLTLTALRILRRTRNLDQAWFLTGVLALLVSPLGWVYYAPLLAGPATAWLLSASRAARTWALVGYVWLCVPYTVLARPLGLAATLLLASAYTWGLLSWFIAATLTTEPGRNLRASPWQR